MRRARSRSFSSRGSANGRQLPHGAVEPAHEGSLYSVNCAKDWPSSGLPRSGGFFAFGKAVHESLGDRYRVVAQIPGSGSELTIQGKTSPFDFSAKGLEKALSEAVETPFALLPVRGSDPVNLDKAWPLERLPEESVKLGQQADVLAFIKTATPAKKNW